MWALEEIAPGVQRAPLTHDEGSHGPVPVPVLRCQRCGDRLTGRATKWCSENCRKRSCEDAHRAACVDCGATLGGGSAWRGEERCVPCNKAYIGRGKQARIEDVAAMYRAGMSCRAIATELGYGPNSSAWEITAARRQGLIGYRYKGWESRDVAA